MTKLWELPVWLMLYKGPNDTVERFLKAPPREMPENYYVAEAREAEEGRTSAGSRRLFLKSNAEWEPPPEWSGRRESRSRSGRRRLSDRAHSSLSRELREAPGRRRLAAGPGASSRRAASHHELCHDICDLCPGARSCCICCNQ